MDAMTLIGVLLFVLGAIGAVWGFLKLDTKKGKTYFGVGLAMLLVGAFISGSVIAGFLTSPGGFTGNQPNTAGWQVCLINVAGGSIGAGTCPTQANGILTMGLGQPGYFSSGGTGPQAYWNANFTITPPAGSTQVAYNLVVAVGSVMTVSNTSNSANFGPILATRTSGAYDVKIGSSDYQTSIQTAVSGTKTTVALIIHWGNALSELAVAQYPISISFTIGITDQNSGASYGSVTFSATVTHK